MAAGQAVKTGFVISDANSLGFTAIDSSTSVVATAVTSETIGDQASPGPFLAAGSGAGATGPSEAPAQAPAGQASESIGDFSTGKLGALDLRQDFARGSETGASSALAGLMQATWSAETTAPQFAAGGFWTDTGMPGGGNYASTAAAFGGHH